MNYGILKTHLRILLPVRIFPNYKDGTEAEEMACTHGLVKFVPAVARLVCLNLLG